MRHTTRDTRTGRFIKSIENKPLEEFIIEKYSIPVKTFILVNEDIPKKVPTLKEKILSFCKRIFS